MFVNLAVLACSLTLASAAYNGPLAGGQPADLYPAGVDPKACPNFPDCTNPAVAVNQVPEKQQFPSQYSQYPAQSQYQPRSQQYQPQQYNPQRYVQPQQYAQPQQYVKSQKTQYPAEIQNALNRGEYIGDGDYHGEGLAEADSPKHAGVRQQAYNPAPVASQYSAGAYTAAQYNQAGAHAKPAQIPAGVDARSCPNYPFCH